MPEILSDGSIFFFSTSTVFTNWFVLASDEKNRTADNPTFLISIMSAGFVTLMSLVCYSTATFELSQKKAFPFPKSNYMWAQIVCFFVAVAYGFYASSYCGLFKKAETEKFVDHV